MKAFWAIPSEEFVRVRRLYHRARAEFARLRSFDNRDLCHFLDTRNEFVHYGFTPQDDENAAELLLKTGIPFARACYKSFFDFDLRHGLVTGVAKHLEVSLVTYRDARTHVNVQLSRCFGALAHHIRWSLRGSLMSDWERYAVARAEEQGVAFESTEAQKDELASAFGASWPFDCPVCDEIDALVCELDESRMKDCTITLKRAACVNCSLLVVEIPFLADALVGMQIEERRTDILHEYGYDC